MKKHLLNSILILSSVFTFAQNGPPWKPTGNNATIGDFLGTTNNIDLPFKTNNTTRFTLNSNGDIVFNSLANSFNSSFLSIDQNGKVNSIDQNSLGLFQRNGNDYYITNGNLGIGLAPSPSFKLDVLGDARISNNLFVGGGIVITSKVDASIEVKAGNILVSNDMDVSGNSRVGGILTSPNGFMVDNSSGFKFTPGSTPGSGTFQLGKIQPFATPCAAQPQSGLNVSIGGNVQIYDPNNANTGLLNLQTWSVGSNIGCSIDASVAGNTGNTGLLINYFCGNNTFINTGASGGTVYMGKTVIGPKTQKTGVYSNAQLTIDGITVSKEIVVTQQNWADYVFAKGYQLPAWKETENYFITNEHLKDVPTAKEISENGNNIGETSVIFLKKLEEAYLYIGNLHSDIADLKKEIQELKKTNEILLKKN